MDFLNPEPEEKKKFTEPRYDDIYYEGVAALDKISGEPITEQELVIHDPFDPARIDDLLKNFHDEVDKMAQKAQSIVVIDDASCHIATLMEGQAGQLYNALEKTRVKEKAPYKKMTDYIDGNIGGLAKRIQQIRQRFNLPITQYLAKKENERREAERKAKEEAARLQAELDEKARIEREKAAEEARLKAIEEGKTKKQAEAEAKHAAALVEDAPTIVMEAPAELKINTDAGSAKLAESWDFEILNPMMLPESEIGRASCRERV